MSEVKKISPVGNIYGWEESQFGEFVLSQDYDDLAEEAQALREEVAALKHSQQVLIGSRNAHRDERDAALKEVADLRMARDDFKLERDLARKNFCDEQAANYQLQAHLKSCLGELAELRARVVVVPERDARRMDTEYPEGWNACLDELARLNGKVVSEADIFASVQAVRDRYPVVVFPSDGASGDCRSAAMARVVCDAVMKELSTLLNQDKENGNG